MDIKYPGFKEMLKDTGLSVQGQERYQLQISIDQRENRESIEMQKPV